MAPITPLDPRTATRRQFTDNAVVSSKARESADKDLRNVQIALRELFEALSNDPHMAPNMEQPYFEPALDKSYIHLWDSVGRTVAEMANLPSQPSASQKSQILARVHFLYMIADTPDIRAKMQVIVDGDFSPEIKEKIANLKTQLEAVK